MTAGLPSLRKVLEEELMIDSWTFSWLVLGISFIERFVFYEWRSTCSSASQSLKIRNHRVQSSDLKVHFSPQQVPLMNCSMNRPSIPPSIPPSLHPSIRPSLHPSMCFQSASQNFPGTTDKVLQRFSCSSVYPSVHPPVRPSVHHLSIICPSPPALSLPV